MKRTIMVISMVVTIIIMTVQVSADVTIKVNDADSDVHIEVGDDVSDGDGITITISKQKETTAVENKTLNAIKNENIDSNQVWAEPKTNNKSYDHKSEAVYMLNMLGKLIIIAVAVAMLLIFFVPGQSDVGCDTDESDGSTSENDTEPSNNNDSDNTNGESDLVRINEDKNN